MQVTVTGKHLDVTTAIRDYAAGKVAKVSKLYDRISGVEFILGSLEHREHEVELIAHVHGHPPFVSKVQHADLYAGIDEAIHKLGRQLTDHKERTRARQHSAA